MFIKQYVNIGSKVEIYFTHGKDAKRTYISKIQGVNDENNRVIVDCPMYSGRLIKLPVNETCSIIITTASKVMYACNTKIIEYKKISGQLYLILEIISEPEKMQRREYFRFQCLLPMKFLNISAQEESYMHTSQTYSLMSNGVIKDLSGGGIRFVSNEILEENDLIQCVIMLDRDYILVTTKILRKQELHSTSYKFEYRGQFDNISKSNQDIIIQFIFNAQRKNLKKSVTSKA